MAPRTRAAARKARAPLIGGWDVLPHGLGGGNDVAALKGSPVKVVSAAKEGGMEPHKSLGSVETVDLPSKTTPLTLSPGSVASKEFSAELTTSPLSDITPNTSVDNVIVNDEPKKPGKKRKQAARGEASGDSSTAEAPRPKRQKTARHPYGLTPGLTPFPNHEAPTAAQAQEVFDILAKHHGYEKTAHPVRVPEPSLTTAGCGEVPSVLDALLRTVLSGNTTFEHANKMLRALVNKYGILSEGIGKGSVDWNKVRIAPWSEVYETISLGGLARIKTKGIKNILDKVYEDNKKRVALTTVTKKHTDNELISLNYMLGMNHDEAMDHFLRFDGVGVKTASCVILFCLQLPSFAVDTHVHRFCQWLRWVPPNCSSPDKVFMHGQVRVPDHLKYGLHQLFIRHGQTCHRCSASTMQGTKEWEASSCPIEHLLDRTTATRAANKVKIAKVKVTKVRVTKRKRVVGKEAVKEDLEQDVIENAGDSESSDAGKRGELLDVKVEGRTEVEVKLEVS